MVTNNAINVAEGTTGQLLVGVTGAAPAFSGSAAANFDFTNSAASTARTLTVQNTSNTSGSHAVLAVASAGASGGDPYTLCSVSGGQSWAAGIDVSDSSSWKISASSGVGTSDTVVITTAGAMTKPLQPCFSAYLSGDVTNVTGDGTVYTIVFDQTLYDQTSSFNTSTGIFTAPRTGKYLFTAVVKISNVIGLHPDLNFQLVTTNRVNPLITESLTNAINSTSAVSFNASILTEMTSGHTAKLQVAASGALKEVSVLSFTSGPPVTLFTNFTGVLIC